MEKVHWSRVPADERTSLFRFHTSMRRKKMQWPQLLVSVKRELILVFDNASQWFVVHHPSRFAACETLQWSSCACLIFLLLNSLIDSRLAFVQGIRGFANSQSLAPSAEQRCMNGKAHNKTRACMSCRKFPRVRKLIMTSAEVSP